MSAINGKDDCGFPCLLTWSAHKQSDSSVRNAMKSFWYDHWAMNTDLERAELFLPANNKCAETEHGNTGDSTEIKETGIKETEIKEEINEIKNTLKFD
ncbi:hypothetical protein [Endozoicomonas ascidiicola]|uniref:hypothetical protein n=1 Tax=Endozoicomonas ascidiicola TaxID=1698521 RepID=UPI00082B16AC|nr:hypothetical protein [Endozoicomonas ascidiicola]